MGKPIVRDAALRSDLRIFWIVVLLCAMLLGVIISAYYLGYQIGFRAGAFVGYEFARNHSACLIPVLPVP
jgi:hypothetical protein